MKYDLSKGLPENFLYAASTIVHYRAEFHQEDGALVNETIKLEDLKAAYQNYAYISVVDKDPVALPVEMEVECAFDKYGAPLIVFSESIHELENGDMQFGTHYEAVLYESGINLWHLTPQEDGTQKTVNLCRAKLPFPAGEKLTMKVRLTREGIEAVCGELTAKAEIALPEKMYVGFTACEGINRFYSFSVKNS